MLSRYFRFSIHREIASTALPLLASMLGGMLMMFTDRVILSYYSPDVLAASGPAVFTAMTVIAFFSGTVGVTRAFVAQSYANCTQYELSRLCLVSFSFSVLVGLVLLLLSPWVVLIPELSSRPDNIVALEKTYIYWACYFGFFIIINAGFSCFLAGQGRTKMMLAVNTFGLLFDLVFTLLLVFGWWGFPEWGIKGSAVGTLISCIAITVSYLVILRREVTFGIKRARSDAQFYIQHYGRFIKLGVAQGLTGASQELGYTVFIWIVALIGLTALSANNIAITALYLMVIPVAGWAFGCSILIGQAVGRGDYEKARDIFFAGIIAELLFVLFIGMLTYFQAAQMVQWMTSDELSESTRGLATETLTILWMYGLGFVLSTSGTLAMEALGHTYKNLTVRVVFAWLAGVPICFYLAKMQRWDERTLLWCWYLGTAIEFIIGFILCVWFLHLITKKDNKITVATRDAEVTS